MKSEQGVSLVIGDGSVENQIGRQVGAFRIIRCGGLKVSAFLHIQIVFPGMGAYCIHIPDGIFRPGIGCIFVVWRLFFQMEGGRVLQMRFSCHRMPNSFLSGQV